MLIYGIKLDQGCNTKNKSPEGAWHGERCGHESWYIGFLSLNYSFTILQAELNDK
jgi:hypothetical protein